MARLRTFLKSSPLLVLAALAAVFAVKALVPQGYMIAPSASGTITVTICSSATPGAVQTMEMEMPGMQHGSTPSHEDAAAKSDHCAFSGLGQFALGSADTLLLAALLAFILLLGTAPLAVPPARIRARLRPPLRGPPAFL